MEVPTSTAKLLPSSMKTAKERCDRILGCVVGLLIVLERFKIVKCIGSCQKVIRDLLLHELRWFQTAKPGGVTLHEILCTFLSTLGTMYTLEFSKVYETLESMSVLDGMLLVLGAIMIVFGLMQGLRALLFSIETLVFPISVPAAFADVMMSSHLKIVAFLWNAMRGNMQSGLSYTWGRRELAVGSYHIATLLFMPTVLTLPTILWYGLFFSFLGKFTNRVMAFFSGVLPQ